MQVQQMRIPPARRRAGISRGGHRKPGYSPHDRPDGIGMLAQQADGGILPHHVILSSPSYWRVWGHFDGSPWPARLLQQIF
jgi:hypothetical protein